MTIDEIKEKVNGQEYEFLKNDEHLGSNIILLGLGGSYSYGMSIEGKSDVDIRGGGVTEQQGRDFAGTGAEGVAYSGIL